MAHVELEVTRILSDRIEGRGYGPAGAAHFSVPIANVLAPPNIPGQDNGHVFRPGVGIARRIGDPWLQVGDFVMVEV